jgi:hypothetical protein
MFNWLKKIASATDQPRAAAKDNRVKERRGRPREGQGVTKDRRKDMRGRPYDGQRLYKDGTK